MTNDHGQRLVFVSHSGADTWVARQIAREIAECGAVPFLDGVPILLKKRDLLPLNEIDIYLGQLRGRTQRNPTGPDEEVK